MNIHTEAIHIQGIPDEHTRAIIPPVCFSTIFAMDQPSSTEGFQYGRINNPTRAMLEEIICKLHAANHAAVFSSGSAAITATLSILNQGDHIVAHDMLYEGTKRIIGQIFAKFGIQATFVDLTKPQTIHHALTKHTKMLWIETPTNPLLEVLDIHRLAKLAHEHHMILVVDNTLASPLRQRPLSMGADIVVESLTKAINGHSDCIGGLVATNNAHLFRSIRFFQQTVGAVLSPFDCFLTMRGIKTLDIRLRTQDATTQQVVRWMKSQKGIQAIHFPDMTFGHKNTQMVRPGSVVSFEIDEHHISPQRFVSRLHMIAIAHSFGGPETVIQQPKTMMDISDIVHTRQERMLTNAFFRLSVGLEHPEDIIADLKQALAVRKKI